MEYLWIDTRTDGSPEAKKMFGRTDGHTGYREAGSPNKAAGNFREEILGQEHRLF